MNGQLIQAPYKTRFGDQIDGIEGPEQFYCEKMMSKIVCRLILGEQQLLGCVEQEEEQGED